MSDGKSPMVKAEEVRVALEQVFNTYFVDWERYFIETEWDTIHRTLQQSIFRFIIKLAEHHANTEFPDGRNTASVELCKKIMKIPEEFRSLPLV